MKSDVHDEQMTQVYGHIYEDLYDWKPAAMDQARQIIHKNLIESEIQPDQLADMNVLNIGTGRETMVFHEFGARNVYHFDVSPKSVYNLTELARRDDQFSNIHSCRLDICETENLGVSEGIDFVYLSGVLHHLHDPAHAMQTIFNVLNPDARLFFRIYRSGCLAFFVVDFIRRFICFDDAEQVDSLFYGLLEDKSDAGLLHQDLYDDFFVPVLRLFDPEQVNRWFRTHGFEPILEQSFPLYDHSDTSSAGQGWSLNYQWTDPSMTKRTFLPFPSHVDQMSNIPYVESYIRLTVKQMRQFLGQADKIDPGTKIRVALQLYQVSQLYRQKDTVEAAAKHLEIQNIIQEVLPDIP
ncbi:MAG: class I SAM-dependent methyltransferase [Sedimentisphaerales bacterium]|nr:class I SAM-dependent methyltransferase [Sedimentisphaerales bacterium]